MRLRAGDMPVVWQMRVKRCCGWARERKTGRAVGAQVACARHWRFGVLADPQVETLPTAPYRIGNHTLPVYTVDHNLSRLLDLMTDVGNERESRAMVVPLNYRETGQVLRARGMAGVRVQSELTERASIHGVTEVTDTNYFRYSKVFEIDIPDEFSGLSLFGGPLLQDVSLIRLR